MTEAAEATAEAPASPAAELERPPRPVGALTKYEPQNLSELSSFAKSIAGAGLCPDALRGKPSDVSMVLIRGAEMGLSAMTALQNLVVIKGKITISADLLRARCQAHPACEMFEVVEADDQRATVRVRKAGWSEPLEVSFTIEEAKRAGLAGKDNWKNYTQDMLVARATSRAARRFFPDVTAGAYTTEEVRDIDDTPRRVEVKPTGSRAEQLAQMAATPSPTADVVEAEVVDQEEPEPELLGEKGEMEVYAEAEKLKVDPDELERHLSHRFGDVRLRDLTKDSRAALMELVRDLAKARKR